MLWTIEHQKECIRVTFDSSVLFGDGSARLTRYAEDRIRELAGVVAEFGNPNIVFESRIHSEGTYCSRKLSLQRASVVANLIRTFEPNAPASCT